MKFSIPYDPLTEVITNSCLDFDLGFELEGSWLLWRVRPEHTLKVCVLVSNVLIKTNLFQVCYNWSLYFTKLHLICF
ncbi:hypothetical protein Hanom_Chr14g01268411 [Helianthus anomalus]